MNTNTIKIAALSAIMASIIPAAMAKEPVTGETKEPVTSTTKRVEPSTKTGEKHARAERKYSGRITAINRDKKTITIEDRQSGREVLHIRSNTKITKGKTAADWDALKDGDTVHATAKKFGAHKDALSLEVEAPAQPK